MQKIAGIIHQIVDKRGVGIVASYKRLSIILDFVRFDSVYTLVLTPNNILKIGLK